MAKLAAANSHYAPPPRREASVHIGATRAKGLMTSAFGAFARDDEYGSRAINPMGPKYRMTVRP